MRIIYVLVLMALVLVGCSLKADPSTTDSPTVDVGTPQAGAMNPMNRQPVDHSSVPVYDCSTSPGADWTLLKSEVIGNDPPQAIFSAGGDAILTMGPDNRLWQYDLNGQEKIGPLGTKPYQNFSLSQDGTQLAGVVDGALWILNLETGVEHELGIQGKGVLAWSASDDSIFFVGDKQIGELNLISRTITWHIEYDPTDEDESRGRLFYWLNPTGDLSADGTQLLLSAGHSGSGAVFRFDLELGKLYWYPNTSGFAFSAHWHPDQNHILYAEGSKMLKVPDGEIIGVESPLVGIVIHDVTASGQMLVLQNGGDGMWCWHAGPVPNG